MIFIARCTCFAAHPPISRLTGVQLDLWGRKPCGFTMYKSLSSAQHYHSLDSAEPKAYGFIVLVIIHSLNYDAY